MNTQLEELYLEAEQDIRNSHFVDAFRKYESILYDEPNHGPTLNSLGWLYKTQIEDVEKAENYYRACIRTDPSYPHAWHNYATLLTDMERFSELAAHLETCLTVPTIEKSWVYLKFGFMEELLFNFDQATACYEMAILSALSDEKINEYRQHLDRCAKKMELTKKHSGWIKEQKRNPAR